MTQEMKEIGWSIVGTVLVIVISLIFIFQYQKQNDNSLIIVNNLPAQANNTQIVTLSASEVARHNNTNDCWLIIQNKVYSVANYINKHPGGAGTIIPYCGKEATQAFSTKGGQGSHSSNAVQVLSQFYLGVLGGQIDSGQVEAVNNINFDNRQNRGEIKDD